MSEEYFWRLELDDGSTVQQFDADGAEVPFGSVDLTRVRRASWVPIRPLTGRKTHTVILEPGQTPILRRRHRVIGDRDTVIMYILGARDEEGVLGESHINPTAAETTGGVLRYTRDLPFQSFARLI